MVVDLRSDTVTRPSPAMRRAMAEAEVGDDLYGEDPTVNALQELFAGMVGKEDALFVPSGTMGNQLALRLLARPGTAVVAGRRTHVVAYENAAAATNTAAQLLPVSDDEGFVRPDELEAALAGAGHHQPEVSLVCVEDTHMAGGGRCIPLAVLRRLGSSGVPLHLDGARLFNASVATGVAPAEIAGPATTVMCCLSKGLGAPVGSLLAGSGETMARARRERSRLGGGMRQAGILAAAGIVALTTNVARLADDHVRAGRLASAVADRWGDAAGLTPPETNIVVFRHPRPEVLLAHLADQGVLAGTIAPGVVRLVAHLDVDDAGVELAVTALRNAP
ncbi:MAG TPA: GntG family PLP-dependent aldolase [Acidimicrobiales bacterium]